MYQDMLEDEGNILIDFAFTMIYDQYYVKQSSYFCILRIYLRKTVIIKKKLKKHRKLIETGNDKWRIFYDLKAKKKKLKHDLPHLSEWWSISLKYKFIE